MPYQNEFSNSLTKTSCLFRGFFSNTQNLIIKKMDSRQCSLFINFSGKDEFSYDSKILPSDLPFYKNCLCLLKKNHIVTFEIHLLNKEGQYTIYQTELWQEKGSDEIIGRISSLSQNEYYKADHKQNYRDVLSPMEKCALEKYKEFNSAKMVATTL